MKRPGQKEPGSLGGCGVAGHWAEPREALPRCSLRGETYTSAPDFSSTPEEEPRRRGRGEEAAGKRD